jgi:hypothetical protein
MRPTLHRRRVQIVLSAHVFERERGVFIAVVQDAEAHHLWHSIPLPSYSIAEYLGMIHMAALATRLQEFGDQPD